MSPFAGSLAGIQGFHGGGATSRRRGLHSVDPFPAPAIPIPKESESELYARISVDGDKLDETMTQKCRSTFKLLMHWSNLFADGQIDPVCSMESSELSFAGHFEEYRTGIKPS